MPQWKCDADYEFTKKLDRAGWAWEFMRRNDKYRSDYAGFVSARKKLRRVGPHVRDPAAWDIDARGFQLGADWGQLGSIADPARDEVPRFFVLGPLEPDGEQLEAFFKNADERSIGVQKEEFATLVFDVRRPLSEQLRRAKSMLRRRRKSVTSIKPVRAADRMWLLYLRVLDAREAGAPSKQITALLKQYQHLDKIAKPDRTWDHFARARWLRENPLSLIR